MPLRKATHKGHHTFLPLRRPGHGIQISKAVPKRARFEGAEFRHGAARLGRIEKASRAFTDWLYPAAISQEARSPP
jgi:hypothetical protein